MEKKKTKIRQGEKYLKYTMEKKHKICHDIYMKRRLFEKIKGSNNLLFNG